MPKMATVARYAGFGLMDVLAVFGCAFIIGETLADPGGLTGVLVSAVWFVPMVVLAAAALLRPGWAAPVLSVLACVVAAFILVDAAFGIVPQDEVGPVGALAGFAAGVPLGALGSRRPARAGWLLLIVAFANLGAGLVRQLAAGGLAGFAVQGPSGVVGLTALTVGSLFLIAAALERPEYAHPRSG
ncbi:hypothetical protein [Flindersiella endophytica]